MAAELHVKLSLHINFKRFNCHILKRHWAYLKGVTGNAYKNHGPRMLPFLHLDFKSKVKAAHPTNVHPTGRKKLWYTSKRRAKAASRGQCARADLSKGPVRGGISVLVLLPWLLFILLGTIGKDREPREQGARSRARLSSPSGGSGLPRGPVPQRQEELV